MTQSRLLKNSLKTRGVRVFFSDPYLLMNAVFAGVILLIIGYPAVFSPYANAYPVVCIHEKLTGLPCPACGLSHSFSLIVRGRFTEALNWNSFGIRIFIFFLAQLFMRIVFSINYLKDPSTRRSLIVFDITGSIILFLISFYPFIHLLFAAVFS